MLDLGFENNQFDIVFVNEVSESFLDAYRYSRNEMNISKPVYGYNCTDIGLYLNDLKNDLKQQMTDASNDGSLIGFIGGPPCPDFSVAGKNKGREGDNGKLSQTYVNLICEFKPDFFLFENVKGLWRTSKHREFFEELIQQLHNSGYATTNRLMNSLEFGVPQDRDRIMIFGIRSELLNDNKIDDFQWTRYATYDYDDVKSKKWPTETNYCEDSELDFPEDAIKELTIQYWFDKNDVEHHPNSMDFFKPRQGLKRMLTVNEGDDSKKSYKRLHRWRYSPTAAYGNNEVHLHPYKTRRISVSEAMSIQSLPKEFCLPPDMTLTDKFKTIGNGVPYLLASGVAKSIHDFLEDVYENNC